VRSGVSGLDSGLCREFSEAKPSVARVAHVFALVKRRSVARLYLAEFSCPVFLGVSLLSLVNNAGIMWMPFALTKDGLEMHAAVNHCGHFLLTHLLMDLLIANSPSRIVNVSSRMYKFGNKPIDTGTFRPASEASFSRQVAYQQSKLANILFTCELNRRFGDRGVSSYAVHPGVVATDLIKDVPCGSALKCPIWLICFKTTAQGAGTTVHCLLTDALPTAQSFYFSNCKSGPVPKALVNAEDAQKLWEWSETNVSVKPEKKGDDSDRKT